ncbi:MAG: DUF333 domain-containing protein [Chloroflexota bacterium]|nr:DUF333 domain-containing protein [Chloroflexota bacterium]
MKPDKDCWICKFRIHLLVLLVMALLLASCTLPPILQTPDGQPTSESTVGLANPAALFCAEKGYTYEIRTASDGSQYGVCIFPDGSECDGWEFFRGECGPEKQEIATGITINIVDKAGLAQTQEIALLRRDPDVPGSYEPLISFSEPDVVAELVAALDADVSLMPAANCASLFTLQFRLADGVVEEFGYACQMQTPSYLRGSQDFWHGKDVLAPDGFNALLCSYLVRDIEVTLDNDGWPCVID